MGHCMFGSQLQAERNKPHYLTEKHDCFDILKPGKHALNIHPTRLSMFDVSLALIDRNPPGQMLTMSERNRREGRKN